MKVLKRIPHKGALTGVLAGFAEYFQIDVTLLRVLYVLFVLSTGFFPGVLAYVIAVFLMPMEEPVIHEHKE